VDTNITHKELKMRKAWREPLPFFLTALLAAFTIIATTSQASGQENGNGRDECYRTKADLISDIDHYLDVVDAAHGNPYRLIDKPSLHEHAGNLKARINALDGDKISLVDCYLYLRELAARIQDRHTWVVFPMNCLPESERFFPYRVQIIADRVYVVEKFGKDTIPVFAELLKIDGVPLSDIRSGMTKFWTSDLPQTQNDLFELSFYVYLNTYFDLHSPWEVKYQHDGVISATTVKGVTLNELNSDTWSDTRYKQSTMSVGDETVPVLEIPSFAYGDREDYEKFVDEFFEAHHDSRYIVIDLRRNTGGTGTWGYYLLDHLRDSPYRTRERFSIKVSDLFRDSQYSFKAGDQLADTKDGSYVEEVTDPMHAPQAHGATYPGRVFLLVSARTFSAGVVCAAIFKHYEMGVVVGQETSGKETLGSDPVNQQLPNTGLVVSIPVAIYALPGDNPDRGVIPDIPVEYTIDDIRQGKDKDLDAIRNLILKEK
jgi:hypothetical protein